LQLKESMFLRKESDLKHSIKLLQGELKNLNEQLESNDLNQTQSSVIFQKIVDLSAKDDKVTENETESANFKSKVVSYESTIANYENQVVGYERKIMSYENKIADYESKEANWLTRETELVGLLKETTRNLKLLKEGGKKSCDCAVFEDVLSEKLHHTSWTGHQSTCKAKERQSSNDEERLSNALELSRQRVASLISSKEELQLRVEVLLNELNELKEKHADELENEKRKCELSKERSSKDFDKERSMLEEKHKLEVEKILIIEEVRNNLSVQ